MRHRVSRMHFRGRNLVAFNWHISSEESWGNKIQWNQNKAIFDKYLCQHTEKNKKERKKVTLRRFSIFTTTVVSSSFNALYMCGTNEIQHHGQSFLSQLFQSLCANWALHYVHTERWYACVRPVKETLFLCCPLKKTVCDCSNC